MSILYARFLDRANFQLAWEAVAENQGCAGVDGESIAHFAQQADRYLDDLRSAIDQGNYRPLPLRQILIPKRQGGWRKLGVPTVRDRIVQQAMLNVLHPILERQFEPCSFGYRPGRSHRLAVEKVSYWRNSGYEWVLDADIVSYFDNINRDRLLKEVTERLNHSPFLDLIAAWISVGVLTEAGLVFFARGIPQGAVISPILANVYLDDLDEALTALGLKVVRYADDFVVLAKIESRILQARSQVAELLAAMKLELHSEKTQITNFDRGFRFLGHTFSRDLVIEDRPRRQPKRTPAKNSELRLIHADPPIQPTAMQQAMIAALKAAQQPIPPPLFVALGYAVRPDRAVAIHTNESTWKPDMSTLYLVQQGSTLRKEQERFLIVQAKESDIEIPIREVEQILVFGSVQITSSAISTCLELQIPIVFLTQLGEYKGQLWNAEAADLIIETAQFQRQQDQAFQRMTARSIVQGKLWNSKQLLLRLNRKRQRPEVAEAIAKLSEDIASVGRLENTQTIEQIRGYEGAGAARYFAALGKLIASPGFEWRERSFHPPKDPINSLLSFGYTLLLNNVLSLLLAEGLNPHLGNLHGAERPQAYLAFDLMEEFRSPVVDTLVMKLVNQKILRPTDFSWATEAGGIYLTQTARRVFLKHFEERICETTTHPDVKQPVSYRRIIQLQVQRYGRAVLGNTLYEPFRRVI